MPTANWTHRAPEVVRPAGIDADTVPISFFASYRSAFDLIGPICPRPTGSSTSQVWYIYVVKHFGLQLARSDFLGPAIRCIVRDPRLVRTGQAGRTFDRSKQRATRGAGGLASPARPARAYFVNASAPALATCASCSDVAPDTPTAPMILPSTMSGIPPSSGLAPLSFSSRRFGPPWPT